MKIVPQSYIEKMTDMELATLLLDSGPLSPKTREQAETESAYRSGILPRPKEHNEMQALSQSNSRL